MEINKKEEIPEIKQSSITIENKNLNLRKTNSHIALMFSGGLDSSLLAHLVNKILPITERFP